MELDDVSPVAQDYLKVIWSAVEWGDPPITTTALAERFQTSRAAVSDMMRRLAAQGFVVYEPYKPVLLTDVGRRLAVGMVRRHRLIETFLADVVGYGWEEVHDDAERLEHAASQQFLDRIDALLGYPSEDPHGDPIPRPDGESPRPAAIPLDIAPAGRYSVCRVADTHAHQLTRLRRLGVVPGNLLRITASPRAYLGEAEREPLRLLDSDLRRIHVRPIPTNSPPSSSIQ